MFHRGVYITANNTLVGSTAQGTGVSVVFEDMIFEITTIPGGTQCCNFTIRRRQRAYTAAQLAPGFGGVLFAQVFDGIVQNCNFASDYYNTAIGLTQDPTDYWKAFGLAVTQHCSIDGCYFTGWGAGLWATGYEVGIKNCRIEVNNYGLVCGGYHYAFEN